MERYKDQMWDFVEKLWNNPALKDVTLVKRENQVLSFVRDNNQQLRALFSRPEMFGDISFEDTVRLLLSALTDKVLQSMEPRIDQVMDGLVLPDVQAYLKGQGEIDRDRLAAFIKASLRTKALRDPYSISLTAVSARYFDRYIPLIMGRRKVIYNEIIRRDRLSLEAQYIPEYLGLAAFLRPLFWFRFDSGGKPISLADVAKDQRKYISTIEVLKKRLADEVGPLPGDLLRQSLDSCLNPVDHPDVSGASRLIAIMVGRAADFDPMQKVDKGAETADKSWFSINRRTAKFYGYDPHFLEELYHIAGEEGW